MLPGITPALFGGGGPLGPGAGSNDSFTTTMLHLDSTVADTNGAGIVNSWTANSASFSAGKFGNTIGTTTGNVQSASQAGNTIGTKDFTIDWWCNFTSTLPSVAYAVTPAAGMNGIYHHFNNWHCGFGKSGANYTLSLAIQGSPSAVFNSDPIAVLDSTFHHFAITRKGDTLRFFRDGALIGTRSLSAGGISSFPTALNNQQILNLWNAVPTLVAPLFGNIDEFRISIDIARWLAPFTPPTAAYVSGLDGNDSFTKLLMHFDGVDGSGVMPDSSPAAHGNALIGASATISTAQKKFGTASLSLSGTKNIGYANHTDWDFGAGDFTIDWWEYRTAKAANQPIASRQYNTTYSPWLIWSDANNVVFHSSTNGTSWNVFNGVLVGAMENNVWHHFAIVRNGNSWLFFRDGILQNTQTAAVTLPANSGQMNIGLALSSSYYAGYIDEFRISKGIARWTANFTPPAAPYS